MILICLIYLQTVFFLLSENCAILSASHSYVFVQHEVARLAPWTPGGRHTRP